MTEDISETKEGSDYSKYNSTSLLNLLKKYVKIRVIKGCKFEGFIQCIDPITYSIILVKSNHNTYNTVVIPGHAIIEVTEENHSENIKPPIKQTQDCTIEDNCVDRKTKMISWLKQNLIPVTEVNDSIVFGNVKIIPPYSIDDICTDNTVVAMQIRKLIKQMP